MLNKLIRWALTVNMLLMYGLFLLSFFLFSCALASWYLLDDRQIGTVLYGICAVAGLIAFVISETPKVIRTWVNYRMIIRDVTKKIQDRQQAKVLSFDTKAHANGTIA